MLDTSQVRTDLTLTYRASVDIQQPDYLMDSRVEIGNLGHIGSAEELFRVLENSAIAQTRPGVHVRPRQRVVCLSRVDR